MLPKQLPADSEKKRKETQIQAMGPMDSPEILFKVTAGVSLILGTAGTVGGRKTEQEKVQPQDEITGRGEWQPGSTS